MSRIWQIGNVNEAPPPSGPVRVNDVFWEHPTHKANACHVAHQDQGRSSGNVLDMLL